MQKLKRVRNATQRLLWRAVVERRVSFTEGPLPWTRSCTRSGRWALALSRWSDRRGNGICTAASRFGCRTPARVPSSRRRWPCGRSGTTVSDGPLEQRPDGDGRTSWSAPSPVDARWPRDGGAPPWRGRRGSRPPGTSPRGGASTCPLQRGSWSRTLRYPEQKAPNLTSISLCSAVVKPDDA